MSQRIKHFIFILLIIPFLSSCASTQKQAEATSQNNNAHGYALKSYGHSLTQIKNAAYSGDPDAEYALGYIYYYGEGVQRNPELARSWIQKAAAQDQPLAVQALKIMDVNRPKAAVTNNTHQALQASVQRKVRPTAAMLSTKAKAARTVVAAKKPVKKYSANKNQSMAISGKQYTVQLLGRHQKSAVEAFAAKHGLNQKDIYIYHTSFRGKDWYVLLYGRYQSSQQAQRAIAELPPSLRGMHPWVKPLASVQRKIKSA